MDTQNVSSSVIGAIGYDPDRQILEVRFKTGRIYHYHNVPPSKHTHLLAARSVGKYFNRNIRDRHPATLVYDPEQ